MRMHTNTNKVGKRGFTIVEVLIVVAIVAVLVTVAAPAVIQYSRELKLTELDDSAKAIFVAAQNRLTAMVSAGEDLENLSATTHTVDVTDSSATPPVTNTYHFVSRDDKSADSLVIPGSVDTELAGNHYVVEYDSDTGAVYAVWYWENDKFAHADYATDDTNRSARLPKMVGYYGGSDVNRVEVGQMPIPTLTLVNAEELRLEISIDSLGLTPGDDYQQANIKVDVLVDGKPIIKDANIWDGNGYKGTVVLDTLKEDYDVKDPKDGSVNWTVAKKYRNWWSTFGLTSNPGEDITVTVRARYDGTLTDGSTLLSQSASVVTNSLFERVDGNKAYIAYGRHLQNLHDSGTYSSSYGGPHTFCSGVLATGITEAYQTADINFACPKNSTGAASSPDDIYFWYKTYPDPADDDEIMNLHPINNKNLVLYDGQDYEIRNMDAGHYMYGGLFSYVGNGTDKYIIEHVVLVNPHVHGGDVTDLDPTTGTSITAGALIGSTYGEVTVLYCSAYNAWDPDKDPEKVEELLEPADPDANLDELKMYTSSSGEPYALRLQGLPHIGAPVTGSISGGLIGNTVGTITVDHCYVAVVNVGANCAGGIIGNAGSDAIITNSYSGSYVYGNRNVAGLIGLAGDDVTITNSYAAGEIANGYDNGFVGAGLFHIDKSSPSSHTYEVTNSYAAVRYDAVKGHTFGNDGNTHGETPGTIYGTYNAETNSVYFVPQNGITYASGYGTPERKLGDKVGQGDFASADWCVPAAGTTGNPYGSASPYKLLSTTKELEQEYPYPMLRDLVPGDAIHYGDWLEEDDAGAVVYIEKYPGATPSYGVWGYMDGELINSLLLDVKDSDLEYAVDDGYGVLVPRDAAAGTSVAPTVTINGGTEETLAEKVTQVYTAADGTQYDIYMLPENAESAGAYYTKVALGSAEYWYNSDYACEAFPAEEGTTFDATAIQEKTNADGDKSGGGTNQTFSGVVIRTARQLANLAERTSGTTLVEAARSRQYTQLLDIDYAAYTGDALGISRAAFVTGKTDDKAQKPITFLASGVNTPSYNGREYVIRGAHFGTAINNDTAGNKVNTVSGLFGIVDAGTIENVRLVNARVNVTDTATGSNDMVRAGALAGYLHPASGDTVTVRNCGAYVEPDTTGTHTTIDDAYGYYTVANKSTDITNDFVGGLIGSADGAMSGGDANINISASFAAVKVEGFQRAGGFAGHLSNVDLKACYAGGHTKDGSYYDTAKNEYIVNVLAKNVGTAEAYAGGFAGLIENTLNVDGINYSTCSAGLEVATDPTATPAPMRYTSQFACDSGNVDKKDDAVIIYGTGMTFIAGNVSAPQDESDYIESFAPLLENTPMSFRTYKYDETLHAAKLPYPSDLNDHHGDWPELLDLLYYEVYDLTVAGDSANAGSGIVEINGQHYGFYGTWQDDTGAVIHVNTLAKTGYAVDSGYAYISETETETSFAWATTSFQSGSVVAQGGSPTADMIPITFLSTTGVTALDGYNIYPIPFVQLNQAPINTYYRFITLNGRTAAYNPHFAAEALNRPNGPDKTTATGNTFGTFDMSTPQAKSDLVGTDTDHPVVIRAPWHLASAARYTSSGNSAKTILAASRVYAYHQLLDLDYAQYNQNAIYDGNDTFRDKVVGAAAQGTIAGTKADYPQLPVTLGAEGDVRALYDGHGLEIRNIYLGTANNEDTTSLDTGNVKITGLFGYVVNSDIKSITLKNADVADPDAINAKYVGGLVGVVDDKDGCTSISDITLDTVTVTASRSSTEVVGGLVARFLRQRVSTTAPASSVSNITIKDTTVKAESGGTNVKYIGGAFGFLEGQDSGSGDKIKVTDVTMTDVTVENNGSKDSDNYVGGLAGQMNKGSVTATTPAQNKLTRVTVKAANSDKTTRIGGVVGNIGRDSVFENTVVLDPIVTSDGKTDAAGGFVGMADGKITATDCGVYILDPDPAASETIDEKYNRCSVTVTGTDANCDVGGFAGTTGSGTELTGCFASVKVSGAASGTQTVYVGGFVGEVSGSTYENCYAGGHTVNGAYNASYVNVTATGDKAYAGGFAGNINDGEADKNGKLFPTTFTDTTYTTCSVGASASDRAGLFAAGYSATTGATPDFGTCFGTGEAFQISGGSYAATTPVNEKSKPYKPSTGANLRDVLNKASTCPADPYDGTLVDIFPYTVTVSHTHHGDWVVPVVPAMAYVEKYKTADTAGSYYGFYVAEIDADGSTKVVVNTLRAGHGQYVVEDGYYLLAPKALTDVKVDGAAVTLTDVAAIPDITIDDTNYTYAYKITTAVSTAYYVPVTVGDYSFKYNPDFACEAFEVTNAPSSGVAQFNQKPGAGGDGDTVYTTAQDGEIVIRSARQLANLQKYTPEGGSAPAYAGDAASATYRQLLDVDFNEYESSILGKVDTNRLSPAKLAGGTYDADDGTGSGYIIKNLYISSGTDGAGLFGVVSDSSELRNMRLENVSVTGLTAKATGGLVGSLTDSTVTNCGIYVTEKDDYNTYTVTAAAGSVGGLVSSASVTTGATAISDSFAAVRVQGTANDMSVGGFIGKAEAGVSVEDCYSGGRTEDGKYADDHAKANVSVDGSYTGVHVGGFAGDLTDASLTGIDYTTCSVYATDDATNTVGLFSGTDGAFTHTGATLYSTGTEVDTEPRTDGAGNTIPDSGSGAEAIEEKYLLTDMDISSITAGVNVTETHAYDLAGKSYPFKSNLTAHYGDWVKAEAIGAVYYDKDANGDYHWHGYQVTTNGGKVYEIDGGLCTERDHEVAIVESGYAWFSSSAATLSASGGNSSGGTTTAKEVTAPDPELLTALSGVIGTDDTMYGIYEIADSGNGNYETWTITTDSGSSAEFYVNPAFGNSVKAKADRNRYTLGTGSWPYEIRTLSELRNMTSAGINTTNRTFKQTHDLIAGANGDIAYTHTPGTMSGGTFNGDFYRILDLDILTAGSSGAALFDTLSYATVSNVVLYSSTGTGKIGGTGIANAAGIAAAVSGNSAIKNTAVAGYTVTATDNVGGLVAELKDGKLAVTGSEATVDRVLANTNKGGYVGGLVADAAEATLSVSNSYAGGAAKSTGTLSGTEVVTSGGILGHATQTNSATDFPEADHTATFNVTYDNAYSYVEMSGINVKEKHQLNDKHQPEVVRSGAKYYGIGPGADYTATETMTFWGGAVPELNVFDRDLGRGMRDMTVWGEESGIKETELYIPGTTDGLTNRVGTTLDKNDFPFKPLVTNEDGQPVHYGDWPVVNDYAGVIYWELEKVGEAAPKYHFYVYGAEYSPDPSDPARSLTFRYEILDDLCYDHHIGERATIQDSGYGYFYSGAEDNFKLVANIKYNIGIGANDGTPYINASGNTEVNDDELKITETKADSELVEALKAALGEDDTYNVKLVTVTKDAIPGFTNIDKKIIETLPADSDATAEVKTQNEIDREAEEAKWTWSLVRKGERVDDPRTLSMRVYPMFARAAFGDGFTMGTGSDANNEDDTPFTARTPDQLQALSANYKNTKIDYCVLGHDIDFTDYAKEYIPGEYGGQLFDGKGYRIINLNVSVDGTEKDAYGQTVKDAAVFTANRDHSQTELKNIIMYSYPDAGGAVATIESKTGNAAGLVANHRRGKIHDCVVSGYTIKGAATVGGITAVAKNDDYDDLTITDCQAHNTLVGLGTTTDIGGIVGNLKDASKAYVSNCYTGGTVEFEGVTPASGATVAGIAASGTAKDCYTYMEIGSLGSAKTYPIAATEDDSSMYLTANYTASGTPKAKGVTAAGLPKTPKATYSYEPSTGLQAMTTGFGYNFKAVVQPMKLDGKSVYVHYGPWPEGAQGAGIMYWERYDDGTFGAHIIGLDATGADLAEENTLCTDDHIDASGAIVEHRIVANGMATFETDGTFTLGTLTGETTDQDLIAGVAQLAGELVGGTMKNVHVYDFTNSTDVASATLSVTANSHTRTATFVPGFADFYEGTVSVFGDSTNPYVVRTIHQLDNVQNNGNYKQTHDIYGQGYTGYTGPGGFAGTYTGGGYRILELSISDSNLFDKTVDGAVLDGVILYSPSGRATITKTSVSVGGLVGSTEGSATIKNCAVAGYTVTSLEGTGYVGGLVGHVSKTGAVTIDSCEAVNTLVSGGASVGGLVGRADGTCALSITDSYAGGSVSAGCLQAGGLVGGWDARTLTVKDSYVYLDLNDTEADLSRIFAISQGYTGTAADGNYYLEDSLPDGAQTQAVTEKDYAGLMAESSGRTAIYTYIPNSTTEGVSGYANNADKFEFKAAAKTAGGAYVHYGEKPVKPLNGSVESCVFYWELDGDGEYHVQYVAVRDDAVSFTGGDLSLVRGQDNITAYGFGAVGPVVTTNTGSVDTAHKSGAEAALRALVDKAAEELSATTPPTVTEGETEAFGIPAGAAVTLYAPGDTVTNDTWNASGTAVAVNQGFAGVYKDTAPAELTVRTYDHLKNMVKIPNGAFKQTHDIDADGRTDYVPADLGTGSYDGGGYRIFNLSIERSAEDNVGLFSKADGGAKISNVIMFANKSGVTISGNKNVGGLLGGKEKFDVKAMLTITNCAVAGYDISGNEYVGGLVGYAGRNNSDNYTTISNCQAVNNLSGNGNANSMGGLAGYANSTKIENSYAGGKIERVKDSNKASIGGLVGDGANTINITSSYSYVDLTGTDISSGNEKCIHAIGEKGTASTDYYYASYLPTKATIGGATAFSDPDGLKSLGDIANSTYVNGEKVTKDAEKFQLHAVIANTIVTAAGTETAVEHYGGDIPKTLHAAGVIRWETEGSNVTWHIAGATADGVKLGEENTLSTATNDDGGTITEHQITASGFATFTTGDASLQTPGSAGLTSTNNHPTVKTALENRLKSMLNSESVTVTLYTASGTEEEHFEIVKDGAQTLYAHYDPRYSNVGVSESADNMFGTAGEPYEIRTVDQLRNIKNDDTGSYKQTHDIYGAGASITGPTGFAGTYNGDGYRILDLNLTGGLFTSATGATLENIALYYSDGAGTVSAATVDGGSYAGGLVGKADNVTVNNCAVAGYTITGANAGGIAGGGTITITGSTAVNELSGTNCGGLVGNGETVKVTSSYAGGSVTSATAAGGIAAVAGATSDINNTYSLVTLSATGTAYYIAPNGVNGNVYYMTYSSGAAGDGTGLGYDDFKTLGTGTYLFNGGKTDGKAYVPGANGLTSGKYPFPAVVTDHSGGPVHYGAVPSAPMTSGIFYFNQEPDGSYSVQYVGLAGSALQSGGELASGAQARTGGVKSSGFGYFYTGATEPTWASPISGLGTEVTDTTPIQTALGPAASGMTVKAYTVTDTTGKAVTVNIDSANTVTFNTGFAGINGTQGAGTPADPYKISNYYQLANMHNHTSSSFELIHDIDATGQSGYTPATLGENQIFDGNGYRILNLEISNASGDAGLFGSAGEKSQIHDVVMYATSAGGTPVTISGKNNVGGLVGSVGKGVTISNCVVAGYTIKGSTSIGGIAGVIPSNSSNKIENCEAVNTLDGNSSNPDAGGIVGISRGNITNCYAGGVIKNITTSRLSNRVGGIYGGNSSTTATNCYSYVDLTQTGATDLNGHLWCIGSKTNNNCYYLGDGVPESTQGDDTKQTTAQLFALDITGFNNTRGTTVVYKDSITTPSTDEYPYPSIFQYNGTYEHYGQW